MTLEELKELGEWHGLLFVPYIDVLVYVHHLKEEHRKELSDTRQNAYEEGLQDGACQ